MRLSKWFCSAVIGLFLWICPSAGQTIEEDHQVLESSVREHLFNRGLIDSRVSPQGKWDCDKEYFYVKYRNNECFSETLSIAENTAFDRNGDGSFVSQLASVSPKFFSSQELKKKKTIDKHHWVIFTSTEPSYALNLFTPTDDSHYWIEKTSPFSPKEPVTWSERFRNDSLNRWESLCDLIYPLCELDLSTSGYVVIDDGKNRDTILCSAVDFMPWEPMKTPNSVLDLRVVGNAQSEMMITRHDTIQTISVSFPQSMLIYLLESDAQEVCSVNKSASLFGEESRVVQGIRLKAFTGFQLTLFKNGMVIDSESQKLLKLMRKGYLISPKNDSLAASSQDFCIDELPRPFADWLGLRPLKFDDIQIKGY